MTFNTFALYLIVAIGGQGTAVPTHIADYPTVKDCKAAAAAATVTPAPSAAVAFYYVCVPVGHTP